MKNKGLLVLVMALVLGSFIEAVPGRFALVKRTFPVLAKGLAVQIINLPRSVARVSTTASVVKFVNKENNGSKEELAIYKFKDLGELQAVQLSLDTNRLADNLDFILSTNSIKLDLKQKEHLLREIMNSMLNRVSILLQNLALDNTHKKINAKLDVINGKIELTNITLEEIKKIKESLDNEQKLHLKTYQEFQKTLSILRESEKNLIVGKDKYFDEKLRHYDTLKILAVKELKLIEAEKQLASIKLPSSDIKRGLSRLFAFADYDNLCKANKVKLLGRIGGTLGLSIVLMSTGTDVGVALSLLPLLSSGISMSALRDHKNKEIL